MTRPTCGGTALGSSVMSIWSAAAIVIGAVLAIYDLIVAFVPQTNSSFINFIIDQFVEEFEKDLISVFLGQLGIHVNLGIAGYFFAPTSVTVVAAIIIAACITAAIMIYWAWSNWSTLCGTPKQGTSGCITGVVNNVVSAFGTAHSVLFGFTGNQPRADVVVKSIYWPLVTQGAPKFVLCAGCANCPSVDVSSDPADGCSPEIPCFYHDSKVCAAALGGAIGTTVGAAIGAALGTIAGIGVMAACGCGIAGPMVWACWLVLILAIVVAIVIVVAVALIGAMIGTGAGQATSNAVSTPGGSTALVIGNYVTIIGNLAAAPMANGANAIWFAGWLPSGSTVVDQTASNNSGTTILGQSNGTAPFCFSDPDANIPAAMDVCPVPPP